ncbi:methionine synthase (B12-dependent) [Prevotella sp. tc2-28]|uniref:methionine synthase n=1 Tax=Prevotella sp. tc2-28 TaxID=1761888 RepID=UPI00089573F3|nr:methionine synthase [Prevotella sp. tc2-28]SEA07813.1 methionine synthase (B12-dependent) [Prevotella sp. tc2-28]
MNTTLKDLAKQRILILDGAMGTMIGKLMGKTGNSDELNLTRPDVIEEIHRRYLKAGADIITTNTFSSQRISQADYHLENQARQMALAGARLARKCADAFASSEKPRFVAGSIGPTNKTCSMSPDVSNPALRELTYDTLFDAYFEEADALLEGGVDAILIETIFDTLNAKVAIDASLQAMSQRRREVPIMISVTVSDLAGRTLSGQTLDAFLASISTYPIFSVGLNCSFGARQMMPFLRQLARKSPYYISAYPNAGLPNAMGLYDETAESMAPQMGQMVDEGLVNIIGGCCGTDEHFIEKYPALVEGKQPRKPVAPSTTMWLSGLEMLDVTPDVHFVNVGERCNVAGSRKFLRLIKEKQYDEAISIARKQVSNGALVIDINMDDGLLDARQEMVTFLNMIASEPDIASVPVMIDSSDWNTIVSGLKCVQGKSIVNSISLKEGEEVFIQHALDVKRYGAAVVVMCFDEQGQATSFERRIAIARRAYDILTQQVGMNPLDIIFDPNILAVATGMPEHDAYAADFIKATRWIRQNLPGAHVSGGVSNLSFSFRGNNYIREAMHAVFLYHAIQAGMDFGIVNPATKVLYSDIPRQQLDIIEDVILNRRKDAAERLIALAAELAATDEKTKGTPATNDDSKARKNASVEERLQQALIKGVGDYLQEDLAEALKQYPKAVNIIEGPLMAGMNQVGELFGAGKMFLPQVVKTARTMKQAVAILQPYIEAERSEGAKKAGKVLLATVKGDVHDIGKNIVSVILACNNYEVIDMGVMVPAEQIVRKAIEEHVDMIGLSGLITPSLEEMVNVAHEMQRAGLDIPIMIGGATTSELHVALKIAPVYGGPVVWMKDASQNALVAAKLMNKTDEQQMEKELDARYEHLRESYQQEQQQLLSLEEARKKKPDFWEN